MSTGMGTDVSNSTDACTSALLRHLTLHGLRGPILLVGALPLRLIGEASLRGPVDVLEPDPARCRMVHHAAPAVRIIRTDLPRGLARLGDYEAVISADPADVKGEWNWLEAFETILRLCAMSPRGAVMVDLVGAASDLTAPRTFAQLQSTPAQVLAVDPIKTDLLAYEPGTHDALAANLLARPCGDAPSLESAFAVGGRLTGGSFSSHARQALILTHSPTLAAGVLAKPDGQICEVVASHPYTNSAWRPLPLALGESLLAGDNRTARRMVRACRDTAELQGMSAPIWSYSVNGTGDITRFGSDEEMKQDAPMLEDSLTDFCEALLSGARLPHYTDSADLASALLSDRGVVR